jgi:hypothetical protein
LGKPPEFPAGVTENSKPLELHKPLLTGIENAYLIHTK